MDTVNIYRAGLIEESFALPCRAQRADGSAVFDTEVTITALLPSSYGTSGKSYPVCYVMDGSQAMGSEDAAGLKELYLHCPDMMPKLIYVGVDAPGVEAQRTSAYGAPINTTLFLSSTTRAESFQLRGTGDYFTRWLRDTVKPVIDSKYRTLPESGSTGIIGFSSGGTEALLAGLLCPETFSRVGAFSASTWAWSNWFYGVLANPGHIYDYADESGDRRLYAVCPDKISHLYMYQGGRDGSAGNDRWALNDVSAIYDILCNSGAGLAARELSINAQGTHSYDCWSKHMAECMRLIFGEYI